MSEAVDESAFTCPFCGRPFDGQEALTGHFEDTHNMAGFA